MRVLLTAISICLLSSCAGLADSIRKNQQKQQIYKQHASKYHANCQKEAFSYYPVNMVEKEKRKSLYKPQTTVTCTTFGNTTNCKDTTTDFSGMLEQAKKNSDLLTGNTNTYDINARARGAHIKNCIDNKLAGDSQFIKARDSINNSNIKRIKRTPIKEFKLNSYEKDGLIFKCFYGKKKQYISSTSALPCSPTGNFYLKEP